MSKVTKAYEGIICQLQKLYPNKSKIPNPYSLPDNIDKFLIDGFGIKIDNGDPVESEFCVFSIGQQVSIVLTRELVATDSDTKVHDDINLKLLEDVYKLRKMMSSPDRLDVSSISIVNLGGNSGVTEVIAGKRKYLSIEVAFILEIEELY